VTYTIEQFIDDYRQACSNCDREFIDLTTYKTGENPTSLLVADDTEGVEAICAKCLQSDHIAELEARDKEIATLREEVKELARRARERLARIDDRDKEIERLKAAEAEQRSIKQKYYEEAQTVRLQTARECAEIAADGVCGSDDTYDAACLNIEEQIKEKYSL